MPIPGTMKINILRNLIILIAGIIFPAITFSQNDFESWNSIGFNIDYSKKTSFEVSNEIRLDDNAKGFKKYLCDFGGEHKFNKNISVAISYRYSRIDNLDAFVNEHMIYGKVGFSYKISRFDIDFQTRYDRAFEVYGFSSLVKTEDAWRNKAAVSYNIYGLPLEPFISYEIFISQSKDIFEANKYRFFGGVKYKISRVNTIGIYYGIQHSLLQPDNSFILGLKFSVNLDFNE